MRKVGIQLPNTAFERALVILSRYKEASIAVVALVLAIYFQVGSNGAVFVFARAECRPPRHGSIWLDRGGRSHVDDHRRDRPFGGQHLLPRSVRHGAYVASAGAFRSSSAPIAGVLLGVLIGLVNGIITVRFRVPSLITTVGTFFLLQGVVVSIYNSQPIVAPVQEPFNEIFGENLYSPTDSLWSWHGLTAFTPFLWTLLVVAAMALVLNRTTFGLHTIATGSNIVGAREIGVRTDRIKVYNFMIAGAFAAAAGVVNTVQFASADPLAGGPFLTLQAIAAAVIGGTSLLGGSGTAIGSLLGAFVVATLNNGLVMMGAQATVSDIYLGTAIVLAMILNVQVDRMRARRRV